ncbi:MAG: hypothetical protein JOZ80_18405 [Acidobacteriaceae bacterium]|nr:hypothetical protein [Acidobacteriaceae bacterium]
MKPSCRLLFTALFTIGLLLGMQAVAQDQNSPNQNGSQATPPAEQQPSQGSMAGQENQDNAQQPIVVIDPGKIYNQDPTSWVGKKVILQNVMVEDADKAGNFWVGSDKNHRLLVVKSKDNPNLLAKIFHKGDIVTVDGTIHPAGDVEAQETDASNSKMKKARQTSGVFLLAHDVNIASSTQHK